MDITIKDITLLRTPIPRELKLAGTYKAFFAEETKIAVYLTYEEIAFDSKSELRVCEYMSEMTKFCTRAENNKFNVSSAVEKVGDSYIGIIKMDDPRCVYCVALIIMPEGIYKIDMKLFREFFSDEDHGVISKVLFSILDEYGSETFLKFLRVD